MVLAMLLFAVAVSVDGLAAGFAEGLRGIRVPLGSLLVMNVVSAVVVFLSIGSGRATAAFFTPVVGRLMGGGLLIVLGAWMLLRGRGHTTRVRGLGRGPSAVRPNAGLARNKKPASGVWATPSEAEAPAGRLAFRCPKGLDSLSFAPHSERGTNDRTHAPLEEVPRRGSAAPGTDVTCDEEREAPDEAPDAGARAPGSRKACRPPRWLARFASSLAVVPGLLDEPARADLDSSGTLTPGEALLLGLALAVDALAVGFGAGLAGLSATLTPLVASATQTVFVGLGVCIGRRVKESVLAPGLEKAPGGILILLGLMRLR